jgi:hypothetical protein
MRTSWPVYRFLWRTGRPGGWFSRTFALDRMDGDIDALSNRIATDLGTWSSSPIGPIGLPHPKHWQG